MRATNAKESKDNMPQSADVRTGCREVLGSGLLGERRRLSALGKKRKGHRGEVGTSHLTRMPVTSV